MNLMAVISRVMAEAFVSGLWQGMVLMIAVAGVLRMLPRLGATARFVVWGVAFVVAVAVPLVHLPGHGSADAGGNGVGVRLGMGWGLGIAACWGLLMVMRLVQLVGQGLRLRRIWREAVPVEVGAGVAGLLDEMPRGPVLCTSAAVDAPSVIGFRSPKLLIPEWQMGGLSEVELRQIVLHECEHLRRGDDWMNLAQKIGLALFPLNPALFWADRRMGLERELACDAGVIARTAAPFDYARCLTRLAEQRKGRRSLALALSAWAGESELGRRVHRLLRPAGSMGRVGMRVSVGVLGVVVAGGSLALARMPRLVSFAEVVPEVARVLPASETAVGGARMVPVVYREPVRAVAGVGMEATVVRVSRRRVVARQMDRSRPGVGVVRLIATEGRTGMVSTRAKMRKASIEVSSEERNPFRLMDTVTKDVPVSYAAVPFGNGWLILQL